MAAIFSLLLFYFILFIIWSLLLLYTCKWFDCKYFYILCEVVIMVRMFIFSFHWLFCVFFQCGSRAGCRHATSTEIKQAGPPEGAAHLWHTACLTPRASRRIDPATSCTMRGLITIARPTELTLGALTPSSYIYCNFI